jgi:hypothetical protein
MEKYLEDLIREEAKMLKDIYLLEPCEYVAQADCVVSVIKGHEYAYMLGGLQARTRSLLYWLEKAGLVGD